MSDEFSKRFLNVIAATKRLPLEKVTLDSSFEDLGIDSMDAVEILWALENEFDVSIPDEQAKAVKSMRDMAEGVAKLVAAKAAGKATGE
ncbi:MAG TPA: acyl carrier protein [Bryobacteraceae bacterium]|nr:acyl carrier protein [Bryobacteraceae bacterium]